MHLFLLVSDAYTPSRSTLHAGVSYLCVWDRVLDRCGEMEIIFNDMFWKYNGLEV